MPLPRPSPKASAEEYAMLNNIMHSARKYDTHMSEEYAGREDEIDAEEDEIISSYSNCDGLQLGSIADPIRCQEVFAYSVRILGRITEIYNGSLKNTSKLKAARQTLMDGLLPLMTGGSASDREAKARNCMQTINHLVALEDGLITICESTMKNIKSAQDMASRQLKAIEMDIMYFGGQEALANIAKASKNRKYTLDG